MKKKNLNERTVAHYDNKVDNRRENAHWATTVCNTEVRECSDRIVQVFEWEKRRGPPRIIGSATELLDGGAFAVSFLLWKTYTTVNIPWTTRLLTVQLQHDHFLTVRDTGWLHWFKFFFHNKNWRHESPQIHCITHYRFPNSFYTSVVLFL